MKEGYWLALGGVSPVNLQRTCPLFASFITKIDSTEAFDNVLMVCLSGQYKCIVPQVGVKISAKLVTGVGQNNRSAYNESNEL